MNKEILNTGVQSFIRNFSRGDILTVLLQKPYFEEVDNKELVQQLESRKKCKNKLPSWYQTDAIYYPPKLAIEQSSSEATAKYKSGLVSGTALLDLTGGFGVDSYFFSKSVAKVFYCEKQEELAQIARHNFQQLGAANVQVHIGDGLTFLDARDHKYDWIYLDPSRRATDKSRVFKLEETEPSLPESLNIIWQKTDNILIKTAPFLDISQGIKLLQNVKEVHVVGLENEVKELIWVLNKDFDSEPLIHAVNIRRGEEEIFSFSRSEENLALSEFAMASNYIYEPNAAILKAGAFKSVGINYSLKKLHENSHLYTSAHLVEFPGRRFSVEKVMEYKPRELKKLGIGKANVTTRNFPYSVDELRKKLRIKDGGEITMFFTTNCQDKLVVLICRLIRNVD